MTTNHQPPLDPVASGVALSPLAALAPQLEAPIAAADVAVIALVSATQALRDFDEAGERARMLTSYNILRKEVYGRLSQIPFTNPAAMLPHDFADRFFLHNSRTAGKTRIKELSAKVKAKKRPKK